MVHQVIILGKIFYSCLNNKVITQKNFPKGLLKYDLNRNNTNRHTEADRDKPRRPYLYTIDYNNKAKQGEGDSLLQGQEQGVQCQTVGPGYVNTRNII